MIPKFYEAASAEPVAAEVWKRLRLHHAEPDPGRRAFSIAMPPPNVTGSLHMGHALNNVLQDAILRYRRLRADNAMWLPGTDHGGIATQNVVEREIWEQEKKGRHDLGREEFLKRMWAWRRESGDTILRQLERLGCLCDWDRTRFTLDEVCSRAVTEAFLRFYRKGWIYRGRRMVQWCLRCATALSDIEVEHEPQTSRLWHLRYPLEEGDGFVVVATTRPETMLGDVAVAVHPSDERYGDLLGKSVRLPLADRILPIVADPAVDISFGTGAVKVTPAHDPIDFEIGQRHRLPVVEVIGPDGRMTDAAPPKYRGLDRFKCRDAVVEDLKKAGLLEREEPYEHSVGTCYRCGTVLEPLLSDQWFLKTDELAAAAAEAIRSGRVRFYPATWTGPCLKWLENLRDWCLSRQIWWGHPIPVWYCVKEKGSRHPAQRTSCPPIASAQRPAKCPACGGTDLEQDPDVLDTWFSSALWPFSTLGWPEETPELRYFYPTSVLVTGHEILYLWVARMIQMGLEFRQAPPFRDVLIHGIVRDKQGRKMSKSLGNVIDPLEVMDRYGTDALRFALIHQAIPGRDMQLAEDAFTAGRNFANKIWNASRFVRMHLKGYSGEPAASDELADRWIRSRLGGAAAEAGRRMEEYDPAAAVRLLYEFVWSEFCDWYVEIAKIRLSGPDAAARLRSQAVLAEVLRACLQLLHPFMPFLTEIIWQGLRSDGSLSGMEESVLLSSWPDPAAFPTDRAAEQIMGRLMEITTELRTLRSEMRVPPGRPIEVVVGDGGAAGGEVRNLLEKHGGYVAFLARCSGFRFEAVRPAESAATVAAGVELFVPLKGMIDFRAEQARLRREQQKVEERLKPYQEKLANPDFRRNAPAAEVERVERLVEELRRKRDRLGHYLQSL